MRVLAWRLLQLVPMLIAVSLLAFVMSAALGDPVSALLGPDVGAAQHAASVHALGLDRPWPERYVDFVRHAVMGDFGESWSEGRPVGDLLRERLPASVELAACATLVAIGLGVPLGLLLAVAPRSLPVRLATLAALLLAAVPPFLLGLLLIQLFAVQAGWLPSFGRGHTSLVLGWRTGLLTGSGLRALILPALTLGLFQAGVLMRIARFEMQQGLASRPVRFALARGMPRSAVRRQAMRLVRLPLMTVLIPQIGALLAFSVVTESVFRWPGLGSLLIQSIDTADVPVVSACLMLAGLLFGVLSLLADGFALVLDPRLRGAPVGEW